MTVGPCDANVLTELLGEGLTPEDLMRIPKYHGDLRLLVEGAPHTFSMTTLPPPRLNRKRANLIRQVSRQRHGEPVIFSPPTSRRWFNGFCATSFPESFE